MSHEMVDHSWKKAMKMSIQANSLAAEVNGSCGEYAKSKLIQAANLAQKAYEIIPPEHCNVRGRIGSSAAKYYLMAGQINKARDLCIEILGNPTIPKYPALEGELAGMFREIDVKNKLTRPRFLLEHMNDIQYSQTTFLV